MGSTAVMPRHVADGAVRRGAAALAEDAVAAREADDVPHDQEIAREPELADEREFVRELRVVLRGAPPSPALARALLDELREVVVLAHAGGERKARQRRLQVGQPEGAALGHRERRAQPFLASLPAPRHLRRALEVPLAVGAEPRAHLVERRAVLQRAEHVVRDPPRGIGVAHVVRDHPRNAERVRDLDERRGRRALLGERMVPALDGDAAVEDVDERGRRLARRVVLPARGEPRHPPARRTGEREEPARVPRESLERDARDAARMVEARSA